MTDTAIRAIGARRNNAELVVDLAQLGYLNGRVLDATFGLGRFWNLHRPEQLVTVDIDPTRDADIVADFRHLPFPSNAFGAVVLDPPYKLNGTSTGKGPSASDVDYGVTVYQPPKERHQMICDGITECTRVASQYLIVKCQDQVVSGRVHWQTRIFADHAESIGLGLVDMLHVTSYRAQPPGRRQIHARRDYSTALVFEVQS